ncbi:unnamed protein product [Periconia digitata]|uniref:DDE-1 domain-containing protein n=1 Tax=Periconia digitata TaxID=1303443 RepID=A0A9W4U3W2_9PLEO|nr:unnamed protein product [Periconia digitata]
MPAHTSHLLQPLDVGCFSPLKRAYGQAIQQLARQHVYHIDKVDFLTTYKQVRDQAITEKNIQAGFLATGLVPYSPERVLSSLPIVRTPSPCQLVGNAEGQWTAETPHTVDQLQKQAQHIQDLLRRQSQSPTNQAICQLVKGCQLAMHSATILVEENIRLQAAVQRKERKKRQRQQYIARGGALQAQEGQRLATEADRVVQEVEQVSQLRRPCAPLTCTKCFV